MVAIVSGNALGLSLGSAAMLGQRGLLGSGSTGRNGELAYVNAATGNLILQDRDDVLSGRGLSVNSVRTYNSLGLLSDDNGDNWAMGVYAQQLKLTGTRNTAGSTLVRTDRDGAQSTYTYDTASARYVSKNGAGAYDGIVYDSASTNYVWTDGDTGVQERYDSAATGRLLSTLDTAGNTLTYSYNGAGLLSGVLDANGESTFYDYTGTNLTQVRTVIANGTGTTTLTRVRYVYDTSNRLSSVTVDLSPADNAVTDGKTYVTTYTYDGTSKRVASVTQSDGSSLAFTYVLVGSNYRVATVKDGLNNQTSFAYDTAARRTTVTDPLGLVTRYDYDTAGQLLKVTAPAVGGVSQTASFAYNAGGDLTQYTDGQGLAVVYAYDASGNQTLVRDAAGNTITRTFDARNQCVTETLYTVPDSDGAGTALPSGGMTTRRVYDAANKNQLRFVISTEGRVTEYVYNSFGQRSSSIDYSVAAYPVSGLAATAVPTEAQMVTWVGTQDRTRVQRVDLAYDARGQLQKTTTFAATDASGVGLVDGTQSVTQFVFDQAGLLLQTISPTAGSTVMTYDGLGRTLSTTDATGVATLKSYDDANAKTAITMANGLVTTTAYDKAGRAISILQSGPGAVALGTTLYTYDADGRLRMTQDPTSVRQWMLYDDAGRKVADIDANGSLVEYVYDKNNQVTQRIAYATAVNTSALVDASGNPTNPLLATVRPAANAADQKVWQAYDTANRLVKTVDAGGAVVETVYDGASRIVKVIRYAAAIATTALGAAPTPQAIAPVVSAATDRVSRRFYDNDGQLVAELDGEGYLSEYQYDSAGRLVVGIRYATQTAAANWASGTLATLRPASAAGDIRTVTIYNGRGLIAAQVDGENYLTERVYDASGNLTRQVRYATQLSGVIAATAALASIRPAANGEDQVTAFTYDLLNRVSQQTNAEGTLTTYVYDNVGNRVTTTLAVGQPEVRAINGRFDRQGRLIGALTPQGAALLTGGQTQAQIDAIWVQCGLTHAYDAAGRRISTVDQNGLKTLFFYNVDGQLTHTVNALGEVQERQYNALGQLTATIAYGTRIATTGLTGGLVTAALTTAVAGVASATKDRKVSLTYNVTGTVATSSDALGNVGSSAYNAFGEETSHVTALGAGLTRTDSSAYDRRGLQTGSVADVGGIAAAAAATYDAFGRQLTATDAIGNVTRQAFDRLGRVVQTTDGAGSVRASSYDAFDRTLTQTDALGQVTTYVYSTSARSVSITTPEGVVVKTVRTRHGQTQTVTDGKGQVTTYTYDKNGNLVGTATPLTTTAQAFDRANRLVQTTDARGVKTSLTYDSANRVLTRAVDPTGLNLVTTWTYDALGQQISVTDPVGGVTTFVYDLKGQLLTQTLGGLNLTTSYSYDARGKTLTVTSPGGTVTQYVYDNLGRRTQERVDPSGLNIARSWTYAANGNVLTRVEANGAVTRFAYDGENRQVYAVDALGNTVRTEYDAEGRVSRVTNYAQPIVTTTLPTPTTAAQIAALVVATPGKDAVVANRYDRSGRLRFTVDGNGAVTEYKYDADDNVVERIAYVNAISLAGWTGTSDPVVTVDATRDQHTRTVYDALNRATYVADPLGAVTRFVYDGNGNVTRQVLSATLVAASASPSSVATSANDRISVFTYDNANRQTWRADPVGAVTKSEYDKNGNLLRSTEFATTIAAGGTPSTVTANATLDRVTVNVYDAANQRSYSVDALNYVRKWAYDGDGRVTAATRYATAIAAGAAASTVVTSAADQADGFIYDKAGRLSNSTDALGAIERYTYDGLGNKLTFTNKKGSVWTYAYDAAGRLTTETSPAVALTSVAPDGSGKLVEGSTAQVALVTKLTYDALGNLTSRTEAFGRAGEQRTTSYDYDARGRQVKVTYPPVGVYSETTTALATNGQAAVASRAEVTKTLFTQTFYDPLGNAVANVDVAGNASFKTYDLAGRVKYAVDALGYVTGYTRNAFGEAGTVLRYAQATSLTNTVPTSATQAPTSAAVNAVITAAGVNHAGDRLLATTFDGLGRATQIIEPSSFTYDTDTGQYVTAGKTSKNAFNAFGDLVQTSVLKSSATNTWVSTFNYYNRLGQQTASVDALGFVTARGYDATGNLTSVTEYATATAAGSWTLAAYAAPATSSDDRSTAYAYDKANRRTSETRSNVEFSTAANGTSARGNVVTTYGYDALGNLTRTTDATGASVYSYYDALGRVTAVAAPSRTSTVAGSVLIPLTIFRRDAYGNVVVKLDMANSAASAAEFTGVSTTAAPGYTAGAADAVNDRRTLSRYDLMGHNTQVTDASNVSHFSSYNERGQVAKTWQSVVGNDAITRTLYQAFQYDKGGQLTHTFTPAPYTSTQVPGAGVTDTGLEYDAFGDIVVKGINGGRQERYDYDNAGLLWRTNNGDGNTKVMLHDLLGRGTATITSSGSGRDDRDLSLLTIDQVAGLTSARRTDTKLDLLGRVFTQYQPERADAEGGVAVNRQLNTAAVAGTAVGAFDESNNFVWSGTNQVNLSWSSLAGLGSGDVKVELEYWTVPYVVTAATYDESGHVVTPAVYSTPVARTVTRIFTAEEAAAGRALTWTDSGTDRAGGVSGTKRLVVSKKDINGVWQRVIDPNSFGYAGNTIEVAAPADPSTQTRLEMRATGSTGAWTTYTLTNFGSAYRLDASGMALGSYDYKVTTTVTGQADRVTATGTLTLTNPPLTAIGSTVGYGAAGAGVLAWQTPGNGVVQRLNYRVAGSSGAWSTIAVTSRNASYDGVDTSGLPAGTYQYELLWTRAGEAAAYAHATGTFTVVAAVAPVYVPPVGTPNLSSISVSPGTMSWTALVGAPIVTGTDESGNPLYARDGAGNIVYSAPYPVAYEYRVSGTSAWNTLTVSTSGTVASVSIAGLGAGTYDFRISYTSGGTAVALGTGTLTINPQGPGHYETVTVTVMVPITVSPPNPASYITGYTNATYRSPVFVGTDESGNPVLGAHYAWSGNVVVGVPYTQSQIIRYDTVQVPVQVPTQGPPIITGYDESGAPIYARDGNGNIMYSVVYVTQYQSQQVPVYGNVTVTPPDPAQYMITAPRTIYSAPVFVGTDESGNPVLGAHYAWSGNVVVGVDYTVMQAQQQQQQVWVAGTTPPPTDTVTTPPYTPGYTIPGTPAQFSSSAGASAGTLAISLTTTDPGAILTQGVTLNGNSVWLRPTVNQVLDRWGNVIQTSDPRNGAWTTTYRWNANNQLIYVQRPDSTGVVSANSPVAQTYYDALGRQVATRDANGNVNGQLFDAGGNLIQETHADGGVVTYRYAAFGDRVQQIDAIGNAAGATAQTKTNHTTIFAYDQMSRRVSVTHGPMNVYSISSAMVLSAPVLRNVVETYVYDGAGRLLKQTDGDSRTTSYTYDLAGHVVVTTQPLGTTVRAVYDAFGHKASETDANGNTATWTVDYFGLTTSHTDIGGSTVSYTYDKARQLITQTSVNGGVAAQNLRFDYDAAGQMVKVTDNALAQVSTIAYDLAGNHVAERTVQGGVVYQDNHLAYDALGRLRDVADSRVHISITYDKQGNRSFVGTHTYVLATAGSNAADTAKDANRYFQYDAMNRQTVVDAVDASGNLGQQGHRLTYDLNGNRASDTFWGNRVASSGGAPVIIGYDESGAAIYGSTPVTFTTSQALVTEAYAYDNLGRLASVVRDGVQVDHREYDAAGHVLQTGPGGNLPQGYATALNAGVPAGSSIGMETRRNRFDANGRLLHQTVLASDNTLKNEIDYNSYDAAGNLLSYKLSDLTSANYTNTYTYTLTKGEGYQEKTIAATSTVFQPGTTTNGYDVNGNLISVTDSTKASNNRTFVNDAAGRALFVNQNGNVERQLIVNGEVLGRYGVGIDEVTPRVGDGDPNFKPLADFSFGYQPINGNYPTASPGSYTVQAGDTLGSIARGAYGDAQLWWRVADANGLTGDADLRVGQTLTIPNRVGTVHNGADTFKPYDPSKITGDTTPNMPAPNNGSDCGGLGALLVVIVIVVVAVVTQQYYLTTVGTEVGAAGAAGTAAASGGAAAAGTGAAAAGATYTTGSLIAAGAIGGAAGAVAGQIVGNAIGLYDGFDWKAVALGALGGAVAGGLSNWSAFSGSASSATNVAVRAAVGNAVTQGVAVATGLQDHFDWRGVAAAAVGGAVGQNVSDGLKGSTAFDTLGQNGAAIAKASISGFAAGVAAAAARGGSISVARVATDAFGNALGGSLAAASTSGSSSSYDYSKAPDQTAAEDARLGRYETSAQQQELANNRTALNAANVAADPAYYSSPTPEQSQAMFRQSERDYRQANDPARVASLQRFLDMRPTADLSGNALGITPADDRGFFPPSAEPGPRTEPVPGTMGPRRNGPDAFTDGIAKSFAEDVARRKAEAGSSLRELLAQQNPVLGPIAEAITDVGINVGRYSPTAGGLIQVIRMGTIGDGSNGDFLLAGLGPIAKLDGKIALTAEERIAARWEAANAQASAGKLAGYEVTQSLEVAGRNATMQGHSYEAAVRQELYGGTRRQEFDVFQDGRWQDRVADSVTTIGGQRTAVEAKYVEDWARSPYNPTNQRPWMDVEAQGTMLDQARAYSSRFEGGAVYHTNSVELANAWSKIFADSGLQNIKFIITPAVRK